MRLVTGATGLVGGHLLYRFRESATTTIAIYRDKSSIEKTRSIFRSYGKNQEHLVNHFIWKKADILDLPALEKIFTDFIEVYHCAATITAHSFDQMKMVNITGTENLVNLSIAYGVKKFCHVSSISALGDPIGNRAINEEDFFNLDANNTDYAISKYAAEMEVWRATQEGMDVVIVNPGIILGEGSWETGSGQLFNRTHDGNRFYTSGSSGFIDVRDVADIMIRVTEDSIKNERFILVAENLTYQSILSKIAHQFNVKQPKWKINKLLLYIAVGLSHISALFLNSKKFKTSDAQTLLSSTSYSSDKIVDLLEYQFIPIDETIKRICNFYKNVSA